MLQYCGGEHLSQPPLLIEGGVPLPQFPHLKSLENGRTPHGSLEDSGSGCLQSTQNSALLIGSE